MKKKLLLVLGSTLMLFLNTANAQLDDLSFGLKVGGSFFPPALKEASIGNDKYEGKWKMGLQGGLFADYRFLDDQMSAGLGIGYMNTGLSLIKKTPDTTGTTEGSSALAGTDKKADDNKEYSLNMHTLAFDIPVSWLPMGRDGGLSVFVGPKFYFILVAKDKAPEAKESEDVKDEVLRKFNAGLTGGLRYEIAESGFFVGANYDYFFLDTFDSAQKGKEERGGSLKVGADNKDKTYNLHGAQVSVGYDFARLME